MQEGEDGRGNFSGHVPRQDFGLASCACLSTSP